MSKMSIKDKGCMLWSRNDDWYYINEGETVLDATIAAVPV